MAGTFTTTTYGEFGTQNVTKHVPGRNPHVAHIEFTDAATTHGATTTVYNSDAFYINGGWQSFGVIMSVTAAITAAGDKIRTLLQVLMPGQGSNYYDLISTDDVLGNTSEPAASSCRHVLNPAESDPVSQGIQVAAVLAAKGHNYEIPAFACTKARVALVVVDSDGLDPDPSATFSGVVDVYLEGA